LCWRKLRHNARSYTIFNAPEKIIGALMSDALNSKPASAGDTAAPTERAIVVMPDAAERSSGATTAIVYD